MSTKRRWHARAVRSCTPAQAAASAGRAGVVKLRWFVERTCGDSGAKSAPRLWTQDALRYTDWPTLSRLRIPAHRLVLRSTGEDISDRNVSPAWLPPSEHVAFVLRRTRADALHAEVRAVGVGSRGRLRIESGSVLRITPSERDALRPLAQGAPTSQIGAVLSLAPADFDPFLGALFARLGTTRRAGDKGCASARLVDVVLDRRFDRRVRNDMGRTHVGAARPPLAQSCL